MNNCLAGSQVPVGSETAVSNRLLISETYFVLLSLKRRGTPGLACFPIEKTPVKSVEPWAGTEPRPEEVEESH